MAVPPVFVSGQVLTAAQMNQIALWEVYPQTSFTSATTITRDNIFTSDYENYLIRLSHGTASASITAQFRVGGVAAATNYNTQAAEMINATAWTVFKNTGQTNADIGSAGTTKGFTDIYIYGPALAAQTGFVGLTNYASGSSIPGYQIRSGNHSTATAYDGIAISFSSANTGNYTIYGFNK